MGAFDFLRLIGVVRVILQGDVAQLYPAGAILGRS
jgi:hypothetical protein